MMFRRAIAILDFEKFIQLRTHNSLLEVAPNSLILPAVVCATRNGPILVNCAIHAFTIKVVTITVRIAGNEIRVSKIPLHDSFFNVLMRQSKSQPAAGSFAKVQATLAIDLYGLFKRVLVVFRIL